MFPLRARFSLGARGVPVPVMRPTLDLEGPIWAGLFLNSGQSQTEATEPGVGRPVFQVFKFEPRRPGEGVLLMHYVRSWEKPTPDDEEFTLRVTIE